MQGAGEKQTIFWNGFEESLARVSANGGSWTRTTREQARARFDELGVPGPTDEAWRFTSLATLTGRSYATAERQPTVPAEVAERARIEDLAAFEVVLVDGYFRPELSRLDDLPAGVTVASWHDALGAHRDLVASLFERDGRAAPNAFEALNAAWTQDGALIHLAPGTILDRPLHLVSIHTAQAAPTMIHPRFVVRAERGAQISLVEDHVAHGEATCFANVVVDVEVGENARIDHVKLVRIGEADCHLAAMRVDQERDSHFVSHSMTLDGGLVRNDVRLRLFGENAHGELNGLVVARGDQLVDNHTEIHHEVSHTSSAEHYRNVLDDTARGVFAGRVFVAEQAQKTDAQQSNANLLLSDEAQMNTLPQLEIYADDIKASHGATLGQLDENGLFYLRSRGIPQDVARAMLVYAFANAVVEGIALEPVRALVRRSVFEHLPHDQLSEELV